MAVAGNELAVQGGELRQGRFDRGALGLAAGDALGDGVEKLHRLLARAAVDVAQHVERGSDRVVETDAASRRHARDRDARRLRTVVDAGGERGVEQLGLRAARQLAARHEPDHLGEADAPDELLDGVAAEADHAGAHVDDLRAPPLLHQALGVAHRLPRYAVYGARCCAAAWRSWECARTPGKHGRAPFPARRLRQAPTAGRASAPTGGWRSCAPRSRAARSGATAGARRRRASMPAAASSRGTRGVTRHLSTADAGSAPAAAHRRWREKRRILCSANPGPARRCGRLRRVARARIPLAAQRRLPRPVPDPAAAARPARSAPALLLFPTYLLMRVRSFSKIRFKFHRGGSPRATPG